MSISPPATLAARLNADATGLSPADRLRAFRAAIPGRVVFTSSLGIEDQAITHLIVEAGVAIDIVTLDTGRLFPEAYELWALTEARYSVKIAPYYPDATATQALVTRQGINGFYNSVEARKACCDVRKVEPLGRALAGAEGWIVGLRADQSEHRGGLDFVTHDAVRNLLKLSPIFAWTRDDVAAFVDKHDIPVNPLHAKGFVSIGCAPCTRAIAPGEPERAGRWWWEQEDKKECGLHVAPDGRLVRAATGAA